MSPHAQPTEIDRETARHVLFHFGCGGYRPGSFTEQLILTIACADPINRAKLHLVYPGHVAAVDLAQGPLDGIAQLRVLAGEKQTEARDERRVCA